MNPIRVLIVDDHALFRESMTILLQARPNIQVVGQASNGEQGIAMTRELKPDLVLMDIRMPVMDGIEATLQIKTELPDVRVVILTASEDEADLWQAIKNGAQGYLLKDTRADEFYRFIEGAMAGGVSLSGSMATKMVKELLHPSSSQARYRSGLKRLSERESQVLHCLREGPTNQEIGKKLSISESTVKKHVHRILIKLHLENRSQAAVVAGKTSENIPSSR